MSLLPPGVRRLFRLNTRAAVEREVDAELAFHFEEKTRALIASGLTPAEAAEEARRQFGDIKRARRDLVATDRRDNVSQTRADWWEGVWFDLCLAARGLRRAPAMTIAVVVMLGLGVGGAAAMYSLLGRLLFQVGPHVADPGTLRRLFIHEYDAYFEKARVWRAHFRERQVQAIAAVLPGRPAIAFAGADEARLGGDAGPVVPIVFVSGSYFQVLGTRPLMGRLLAPSDDQSTAEPVAVISHGLWRRHFGGDRDVLQRTLQLGRQRYSIVGVAPPGFAGIRPERVDAWVPIEVGGDALLPPGWRDSHGIFDLLVRLEPGTNIASLSGAAQAAYRSTPVRGPPGDSAVTASFLPVTPAARPGGMSSSVRLSLIVAGVAAMLCLIAVANATILLLLRGVQRGRETAVRLALGVGRARLLRAGAIEAVLLAFGGAVIAGIVALQGAVLLQKLIVRDEWQPNVAPSGVLGFAGLLSLVIGLATGMLSGWQASRPDALAALRAGTRSASPRSRFRGGLLAVQGALTVVLIAGLGLYVRSFLKATGVDYVVDAAQLINVSVDEPENTTVAAGWAAAATAELAERLRALPGVEAVSQASTAPIYGYGGAYLRAEGVDTIRMDRSGPFFSEIDAEFLRATGLTVVRGRAFSPDEVAAQAPVALVNDAMAERLWHGGDPIGKCLYVGFPSEQSGSQCRQVVGVVTSYRNRLEEPERMQNYYVPLGYRWNGPRGSHSLVVRTRGPAKVQVASIRSLVQQSLPHAGPDAVFDIGAILEDEVAPWRAGTTLFALFAGLAVALATGGLYSVVAFSVAQRRQEFGIRIAVGARARHLAQLVLGTALRPVAVGLLAGLALALGLGRLVAPLLFQLSPRDPIALAGSALCLVLAAGIACIAPTRSAVQSDPREALQAD